MSKKNSWVPLGLGALAMMFIFGSKKARSSPNPNPSGGKQTLDDLAGVPSQDVPVKSSLDDLYVSFGQTNPAGGTPPAKK